jgi:hypothetical protein
MPNNIKDEYERIFQRIQQQPGVNEIISVYENYQKQLFLGIKYLNSDNEILVTLSSDCSEIIS